MLRLCSIIGHEYIVRRAVILQYMLYEMGDIITKTYLVKKATLYECVK